MRLSNLPAALGIVALSTSLAFAGGAQRSPITFGEVGSWDATHHVLTMADGTEFYLPPNYSSPSAFRWGEHVRIIYARLGDVNYASAVNVVG